MITLFKKFIVLLFSLLRQSLKKNKTGKLAVISYSFLGDTVFTIPAIKFLLKKNKSLTIICFKESKEIYSKIFHDSIEFVIINKEDFSTYGIAKSSIRNKISKLNIFQIIDFSGDIRSISSTALSGASLITGICGETFKNYYDRYILYRKLPHLTDMYLDAVSTVFNDVDYSLNKEFKFEFIPDGEVLIHPFAGWKAKEWPLENFLSLAKSLLDKNFKVRFVMPGDNSSVELKNILDKNKINYSVTESITSLLSLLDKCSFFISNDTGPVHIAALCGRPTFTIFGPTNPRFILNFGPHHTYIQKQISCVPIGDNKYCFTNAGRNGCPKFECMDSLAVTEVLSQFISFTDKIVNRQIA